MSMAIQRAWHSRIGPVSKAYAVFNRDFATLQSFAASVPTQEIVCEYMWQLQLQLQATAVFPGAPSTSHSAKSFFGLPEQSSSIAYFCSATAFDRSGFPSVYRSRSFGLDKSDFQNNQRQRTALAGVSIW
jgi:hypothetical protein